VVTTKRNFRATRISTAQIEDDLARDRGEAAADRSLLGVAPVGELSPSDKRAG